MRVTGMCDLCILNAFSERVTQCQTTCITCVYIYIYIYIYIYANRDPGVGPGCDIYGEQCLP